mmetsp:Transcript_21690/g.59649  ORF Transcript_21690/g.59649 Transcript_21690/m.59649 type:complete len:117 (+) Transcript_21690:2137-2487(+)
MVYPQPLLAITGLRPFRLTNSRKCFIRELQALPCWIGSETVHAWSLLCLGSAKHRAGAFVDVQAPSQPSTCELTACMHLYELTQVCHHRMRLFWPPPPGSLSGKHRFLLLHRWCLI